MDFIKKSTRVQPKVSLVLLDWSVRESFHILHYLSQQTVSRDQFEVIIVEYYSRISPAIQKFEGQVDTWIRLHMPTECYYHKHLMYNVGIAVANGEVIVVCDSDAMVKATFIESIIKAFEQDPNIILHLDQFRNNRRDLYPFCYPDFEEVIGKGCINNTNGRPTGLSPTSDPIHERNYGACFCAKRDDLIAIGGADEHIDFVGHICGPYDFTFRLSNLGKREVWHQTEFLYHTWHPGQAGVDNYLGPHDGRHISSTSLDALATRRTSPHVMNPIIKKLCSGESISMTDFQKILVTQENLTITRCAFLESDKVAVWAKETYGSTTYKGFNILKGADGYVAVPTLLQCHSDEYNLKSNTLASLKAEIDKKNSFTIIKLIFSIPLFILITGIEGRRIVTRRFSISAKSSRNFLASIQSHVKKWLSYARKRVNFIFDFLLRRFKNLITETTAQMHLLFSLKVNIQVYRKVLTGKSCPIIVLISHKSLLLLAFFALKGLAWNRSIRLCYVSSDEKLSHYLATISQENCKIIATKHCFSNYQNMLNEVRNNIQIYVV